MPARHKLVPLKNVDKWRPFPLIQIYIPPPSILKLHHPLCRPRGVAMRLIPRALLGEKMLRKS
ncbi:hypothetical protein A0U91_14910 (plasmid) [Acetobacter persici]|uniref:Uncharacterized protein n=1 Tax=Acetobacter persici TaxID=1076596 RepID=A0A1U9LIR7_9PROT|nr:hypothetical protein A0U91_14910 [Acetobacter persici]